jgi:hypothetical protein
MTDEKPQKPQEKPIDLTHEQIKQREHDAHATVTQRKAEPAQPAEDDAAAEETQAE